MIKPLIPRNNEKLLQAATDGHYQEVKLLLEQGVNPNTPVLKKCTHWNYVETHYPLLHAVKNRYTAIVKLLVEHGADIYAKDNNGCTALMYAASSDNKKMIELLTQFDMRKKVIHNG